MTKRVQTNVETPDHNGRAPVNQFSHFLNAANGSLFNCLALRNSLKDLTTRPRQAKMAREPISPTTASHQLSHRILGGPFDVSRLP
jgi:hypothetical protein